MLNLSAAFACSLPLLLLLHVVGGSEPGESSLRFDASSNAYTGLTFTFDPRLERQIERLHFEHWQSIVRQTSSLLHSALAGRAHLGQIQVLVPYKWHKQAEWPVLQKPGAPLLANRHLKYADADILVGLEDAVYKEQPFAVQHDECAKQGLNIQMPISFLDETSQIDAKLKARLLLREFASHRYGIFKESGFRNDFMYPPFSALPGHQRQQSASSNLRRANLELGCLPTGSMGSTNSSSLNGGHDFRGFDQNWNECPLEAQSSSGLPVGQALACLPYLVHTEAQQAQQQANQQATSPVSFNLMSSDPFSYLDLSARFGNSNGPSPIEWRELSNSVGWHFCGEQLAVSPLSSQQGAGVSFGHNQLAINKQNIMCSERSALDVIRSSDDFRRTQFSPNTFNKLPEPSFHFLQEMPPRIILGVEYAAHLYQSRRLDLSVLEAALAKWLAFDLVADTELGLVLFGQQSAWTRHFKRLDSSIDSRLTLFSPPIDPFEEQARLFSDQELNHLGIAQAAGQPQTKLIAGTCSFARLLAEASAMLQQRNHYDDLGVDLIIVTSGLFIEDEPKIEELIKVHFRPESMRLHLVIYPLALLLDTRGPDGQEQLNQAQSEAVVRSRVGKLLLVERLAKAKLHLVKEHTDSLGQVKMSTLLQFYQILQQISSGYSWDQTHSMIMLEQQQLVEASLISSPVQVVNSIGSANQTSAYKLQFQFNVDQSLGDELVVGFFEPKQTRQRQQNSGKRFALRNLQLRSPNGQRIFTDSHHWSQAIEHSNERGDNCCGEQIPAANSINQFDNSDFGSNQNANGPVESALFEYRAQLGIAGFHLKSSHFPNSTNESDSSSRNRAGTWTLNAYSDEPVQASAVALARVSSAGDSITARCWIQSYFQQADPLDETSSYAGKQLKSVKVFLQIKGDSQFGPVQDVQSRLEIEDELGNIVQNTLMLDDGLGSPDMTKGDGIFSQLVNRANRQGFYRVSVDLAGNSNTRRHQAAQHPSRNQFFDSGASLPTRGAASGQDSACCGSSMPGSPNQQEIRHLSRQLYCGTFYLDESSRLNQARPPRITNLTVINADQENRRVTIRWLEPNIDISAPRRSFQPTRQSTNTLDLQSYSHSDQESSQSAKKHFVGTNERSNIDGLNLAPKDDNRKSISHQDTSSSYNQQAGRYEIKMFTNREAAKRAFHAEQEVGFRFNEWNIEGKFPSPSPFGGQKEVVLRVPYAREGIYYIALKVYNEQGLASPLSTIVQFWMRANLTKLNDTSSLLSSSSLHDASISGQAAMVDADGNIYDKNGELIYQQVSTYNYPSNSMEGISLLAALIAIALLVALGCIWIVACLATYIRRSFKSRSKKQTSSNSSDKPAIIVASTGSSLASSQCASSELNSSSSLRSDNELDLAHKMQIGDDQLQSDNCYSFHNHNQQPQNGAYLTNWSNQPAHLDQFAIQGCIEPNHNQHDQLHGQQQLNHTLINGYPYATVQNGHVQNTCDAIQQAGLESQVQSWTTGVLLSHYDKVKQARERNEAPPVMRLETIDNHTQLDGLPRVNENYLSNQVDNYQQRIGIQQQQVDSSRLKFQIQEQLNSVLIGKRGQCEMDQANRLNAGYYNSPQPQAQSCLSALSDPSHSSPALEGLTDNNCDQDQQSSPNMILHHSKMDQLVLPPPPPPPQSQYLQDQLGYCNEARQMMLPDPSIYSQLTNLQQVNPKQDLERYYTTQWQAIGVNHGSNADMTPHRAQAEHPSRLQNNNSAISEV